MSARTIWHNGKFIAWEKAQVHVLSHALHYGSGVFEGIRVYDTADGPAVFRLKEHVARLFDSASAFGMKIPYSKTAIENAVVQTVKRNKLSSGYIRPIIFFGEGPLGLGTKGVKLHVAIAAWPWGAYLGDNVKLSLGVSKYIRFDPRSIAPGKKITGYYATSVLASQEAHARGFDECILLDHEGNVAEGPGENIFIVKGGKLITPNSPAILAGITRASVIAIALRMKMTVAEKKVSLNELMRADEAFLTGTAAEIAPIGKINGKRIGKGKFPVTMKIREAYLDAVRGNDPRYKKWLTLA